jgi:hypothetical protein
MAPTKNEHFPPSVLTTVHNTSTSPNQTQYTQVFPQLYMNDLPTCSNMTRPSTTLQLVMAEHNNPPPLNAHPFCLKAEHQPAVGISTEEKSDPSKNL